MVKKVDGCVHIVMRKGKVVNVFTHLNELPKDGVVHLKGHKILSFKEFKKSHPIDHGELVPKKKKVVISSFDLPRGVKN
ncbi:MAG: hypothetical protein KJ718_02150 [Nanoarchaeota archaeon]|nr:hypothetical protein [Nanoarchaeota archaeon]MBU1051336.1 hypothetical protein [Nanoarchaeota archaeon]